MGFRIKKGKIYCAFRSLKKFDSKEARNKDKTIKKLI